MQRRCTLNLPPIAERQQTTPHPYPILWGEKLKCRLRPKPVPEHTHTHAESSTQQEFNKFRYLCSKIIKCALENFIFQEPCAACSLCIHEIRQEISSVPCTVTHHGAVNLYNLLILFICFVTFSGRVFIIFCFRHVFCEPIYAIIILHIVFSSMRSSSPIQPQEMHAPDVVV